MNRIAAILVFISVSGTLQAGSPLFGPSKSELEMKNEIAQNRVTIDYLKRRINELNIRLDGLTTVIEGLNATIGELKSSQALQSSSTQDKTDMALLKARITKLESDCARKSDLKRVSSRKATGKSSSGGTRNNSSISSKSNSSIYSEAVRLFQKKKYSEAKKRFEITRDKGYKPAASNYYLGEIAYYTKNYNDAIFYFKKSASLYDKAGYIDTLLLHTAISLDKTGDKDQARVFYQTVIDDYPGKKSAKIAQKKIKKL